MCTPPTPLHPIIATGSFEKWGIDFVTCNPHSKGGHGYIIIAIDYFTKWAKAMPTFKSDDETATIFIFNHVIARFDVPQAIITDHGIHFRKIMITEISAHLGLCHENYTPYYPQENGQI